MSINNAKAAGSDVTLTAGVDNLAGTAGRDTFSGTYNNADTGTFNVGDILNAGSGVDTLSLSNIGDAAITVADDSWNGITGFEKLLINSTGAGAQTITTGAAFEAAFSAGLDMETSSTGGAINLTMDTFSGDLVLAATSTDGVQTITTGSGSLVLTANSTEGAQNITTGTGDAAITATSMAGAQTIVTGTGLASVVAVSTDGAQTITGANLASVVATSNAGAQTITSTGIGDVVVTALQTSGAQTITTGDGDDVITASASATINTGAGNDTIIIAGAGAGTGYTIDGGAGSDSIDGGVANSPIFGGVGDDTIRAGTGADTISGGVGNDRLFGGTDKIGDNLDGNAGNDVIVGGRSDDTVSGGSGDDMLSGGGGKDILSGGTGHDHYVLSAANGSMDVIRGFSVANDTLHLPHGSFGAVSAVTANNFVMGSSAGDANDRVIYNSNTGHLFYDADGNGAGSAVDIAVVGAHLSLTSSDFVVV